MNALKRFWYYLFGPNVHRIHKTRDGLERSYDYKSNSLEQKSQKALNFMTTSKYILYYTTPLWATVLYRRGYYTVGNALFFLKYAGWCSMLLLGVLIIRALGRSQNQEYVTFLSIWRAAINNPRSYEARNRLRTYTIDFKCWPVDFRFDDHEIYKTRPKPVSVWKRVNSQYPNFMVSLFYGMPKELVGYMVAHTLGISLVYPGSMMLLQAAFGTALRDNRNKYIEENEGVRAKLLAQDYNEIDTLFIDARKRGHDSRRESMAGNDAATLNGETLVICCEGNAGFYEVGCLCTPLQSGYSVLGWNHPGFEDSSGQPYPNQEKNAIDVVVQYAIHRLNFEPENIIIFAWSIGGYSALQAANMYPDIKGVLLDATFHDIMPFATKMMPSFLQNVTNYTVRNHLNLHHSKLLAGYKGPVRLIRRNKDEVMNLGGPGEVITNLGNKLLESLLRTRFPNLFEADNSATGGDVDESRMGDYDENRSPQSNALWEWFSFMEDRNRESVLYKWEVKEDKCKNMLSEYVQCNTPQYPMLIGEKLTSKQKTQLVLYLAQLHMQHFPSTHCTPLPASYFQTPWSIRNITKEVFNDSSSSSNGSEFEVLAGMGDAKT